MDTVPHKLNMAFELMTSWSEINNKINDDIGRVMKLCPLYRSHNGTVITMTRCAIWKSSKFYNIYSIKYETIIYPFLNMLNANQRQK